MLKHFLSSHEALRNYRKARKSLSCAICFDQAQVTGYTIIRDIAGMGHHGFHEGRLLFNETASLVLFMAVGSETIIRKIAEGFRPLFEKNSGVMFFSNKRGGQMDYFTMTGTTVRLNLLINPSLHIPLRSLVPQGFHAFSKHPLS
ncbi:MAG: hypothetical protein R3F37_00425 [Candidatus Competibacteraceae bacterium]